MDWKQLIFTIIIGFINIICSKSPLLLCYKSEFLTHFEYGVKSAELHIKIKGGDFEHIMYENKTYYYCKYQLFPVHI